MYDKLVAKVNNIDTSDFVLKTKYQTDKTELEKKIPDASNLVKKTKLTKLENKIPDISNLASKTALTTVSNLVKKQAITLVFAENNGKTMENKTEKLLVKSKLNKLKTFDLSYFIDKSHFDEDGTQNYLVFQQTNKYFKLMTNTLYILS